MSYDKRVRVNFKGTVSERLCVCVCPAASPVCDVRRERALLLLALPSLSHRGAGR